MNNAIRVYFFALQALTFSRQPLVSKPLEHDCRTDKYMLATTSLL